MKKSTMVDNAEVASLISSFLIRLDIDFSVDCCIVGDGIRTFTFFYDAVNEPKFMQIYAMAFWE